MAQGLWGHPLRLLHHEAAGGVLLLSAAILALLMDNSILAPVYDQLLQMPVSIQVGALLINKPLLLWINDGLMAVFFFLVGLEIKRELTEGRLSSWEQASLPALAAIGGMLGPALVFSVFNWGNPEHMRGWAIPAATDIAFALGILALLGKRVPVELKIFLLALAIIDDLGAIAIIALFYTEDLSLLSLSLAAICAGMLLVLNRSRVMSAAPYILIGIIMWVCVLKSGVHATLAGVITAVFIPIRSSVDPAHSPLKKLEHDLHPWVMLGVMPIFAFANAGIPLAGLTITDLLAPLPLGIALGLFVGKQLGVLSMSWLGTRLGICRLPPGIGWVHIYGAGLLSGVGFTMSLFIGMLAFTAPDQVQAVRLGVLSGSLLSGLAGFFVLYIFGQQAEKETGGKQAPVTSAHSSA